MENTALKFPDTPEKDIVFDEGEIFDNYPYIEIDDDFSEEQVNRLKEYCRVTDDRYADWAVRHVLRLREQREKMLSLYHLQKEQLDNYRKKEEERIGRNEEFWVGQLELFYQTLKAKGDVGGKRKSYRLPHGLIGERKLPDQWDFSGADLDLLETIDRELIKKEVAKAEAKKKLENVDGRVVYKTSGEVVTGIRVEAGKEKFYVS